MAFNLYLAVVLVVRVAGEAEKDVVASGIVRCSSAMSHQMIQFSKRELAFLSFRNSHGLFFTWHFLLSGLRNASQLTHFYFFTADTHLFLFFSVDRPLFFIFSQLIHFPSFFTIDTPLLFSFTLEMSYRCTLSAFLFLCTASLGSLTVFIMVSLSVFLSRIQKFRVLMHILFICFIIT